MKTKLLTGFLSGAVLLANDALPSFIVLDLSQGSPLRQYLPAALGPDLPSQLQFFIQGSSDHYRAVVQFRSASGVNDTASTYCRATEPSTLCVVLVPPGSAILGTAVEVFGKPEAQAVRTAP